MSAQQKRFVNALRSGKYPEWIFGEADHLPLEGEGSVKGMGEYLIHTEYPRFLAQIEPNDNACETIAKPSIITEMRYGKGSEAFVGVGWDAGLDEPSTIIYRHIVNLDNSEFDWDKVEDALRAATWLWINRTIIENELDMD